MAAIDRIMPLFIVADLNRAVAFYCEKLGFELTMSLPEDDPFFAIIGRDGVGIMLKHISDDIAPQPNPKRHPWAKWDAFISASDPEALASECNDRGLRLEVQDTDDGLRGFEVEDADGYVLFFGHPQQG